MINLLKELVEFAKKRGADDAEIIYDASSAVQAGCRLQKPEITEISDSCAIGIRIIKNERQSFAATSDITPSALKRSVEDALEAVKYLPKDPFCRLIREGISSQAIHTTEYCDSKILSAKDLLAIAQEAEDAALSTQEITNSEGASAETSFFERMIVSSNGFEGSYKKSAFSCSVSVVAGLGDNMKTDYEYDTSVFFKDLKQAQEIGDKAAQRAIAKLGAKYIQTALMPVIFERRVGKQILGSFLSAINGKSISQKTSFLKNDMGKVIFPNHLSIIDNPRLSRGKSSRPFDDEGVIGKPLSIIENGLLKSWILDHTSAAKLGLKTTGHSSRGLSTPSFPRTSNILLQGNCFSIEDILAGIPSGFYVTDLMGEGGNSITGDFSTGASGFLIENGKITTPIHEATIAGQLRDMFSALILGNDFENKGGLDSPTFMIPQLTVGGI